MSKEAVKDLIRLSRIRNPLGNFRSLSSNVHGLRVSKIDSRLSWGNSGSTSVLMLAVECSLGGKWTRETAGGKCVKVVGSGGSVRDCSAEKRKWKGLKLHSDVGRDSVRRCWVLVYDLSRRDLFALPDGKPSNGARQ